ncbi:pentapeptide repeat-containing protein [Haloglomus litoreum]|uniref:pentapeptide repeat-containing protein n=1 Tax=Haloglomus litoreum TaxID=3034026 RepID=UPI0023E8C55C|nr:pentapeptide repeat-containing protein [Haloglomus sp. DT116]
MPDGSDDRCSFSFDPASWQERTGLRSPLYRDLLDEDEAWRCHRDTHGETDRCLFHLPPAETDDDAVREAFLDAIDRSGERPKRFVGARFGTLDLDHEIVACADNHEIDLRHAVFEGETTWRYAIVRQPITVAGATFHERPVFTEATFEGPVSLDRATFETAARFIEADFSKSVTGHHARFTEGNFHNVRFGGLADFTGARFADAQFRETEFDAVARFNGTTFEEVSFAGAEFGDRVYFDAATLPETVGMEAARFADVASFEDLDLQADHCRIDCTRTTIPAGRLYLPADGTLVYDLAEAEIGAVSLTDGRPPSDLFDHYRFLDTAFSGFDFGRYREVLHEANWRLHEVREVPGHEWADPSLGELENTYLKAKNGANAIGDTKAAAEFFRREMLYRRDQYLPTARDGTEPVRRRARAAGRWTANTLLNLTAGYGERPSRVIAVSMATILCFSGVFALVQPDPLYGTPVGYLVLSFQSFITLVLGGAADVGGPWIRLLAQVEGFVGAFLIALFVFTLTRSIHR